jgi:CubicO group peptidase (beta-lactamase class C family)
MLLSRPGICSATLLAVWIGAAPLGAEPAGQTPSASPPAPPARPAAPGEFAEAVDAAAELPRIHSLLVSREGELVLERYFNGRRATTPANIKSASKSVISALVGLAIDRGHVKSVRQPVADFFPDLFTGEADPKREITIEDLLTMRSGLESTSNRNYGAWVQSRNWVRYALARPLLTAPGTFMQYSTGNSHVLSAILTKATGRSTWQFAQDALARPMGFSLAQWPRDPQGIYFGGNDMLMTPRQMVAFGELFLNRGRVKELQLVPASWIASSFVPRGRSGFSEELYGYGWWIREIAGEQAYYAWGYGGQFIFLVPRLELVVVTTSSATVSDERRSHRRTVDEIIEQLIVKPISEQTYRRIG